MCTPSVPKAPPAAPEQNKPRFLLSRDQFDELRGGYAASDPLMIMRPTERSTSATGNLRGEAGLGLGLWPSQGVRP